MALTSGDILVYDGSQWNNQPSTSGAVTLTGIQPDSVSGNGTAAATVLAVTGGKGGNTTGTTGQTGGTGGGVTLTGGAGGDAGSGSTNGAGGSVTLAGGAAGGGGGSAGSSGDVLLQPSGGDVGIGTASPSARLHVTTPSDWTDASGTRILVYCNPSANPTASSSASFRAMNAQLILKGSHAYTGVCYGMIFLVTHQGTANISNAYGLVATTEVTGNGGSISSAFGAHMKVYAAHDNASVADGVAGEFQIQTRVTSSTGGSFTNAYGMRVNSPDMPSSGGHIDTVYGLRIQNQGHADIDTAYGLYVDSQSGSGTAYAAIFAGGNVGIGTTTPKFLLHVAGALAYAVPSSAPTDGDLSNGQVTAWVDETNNLLKFRVKYSGGTLKTGSVALS
jgi:hypothetical protein